MYIKTFLLSLVGALLAQHSVNARLQCETTADPNRTPLAIDFVFVLDSSNLMQTKINGIKLGVRKFLNDMSSTSLSARYAVVIFGGGGSWGSAPQVVLPFSQDSSLISRALDSIRATSGNQEASLEVFRMLATRPHEITRDPCILNPCPELVYRYGAAKVFIHATDEDSDLPVFEQNRMPGQTSNISFCPNFWQNNDNVCFKAQVPIEPSFTPSERVTVDTRLQLRQAFRNGNDLSLHPAYQAEVDLTASILIQAGVYLFSIISRDSGFADFRPVSAWSNRCPPDSGSCNILFNANARHLPDTMTVTFAQFGHLSAASQERDFSEFNREQTLDRLRRLGAGKSLQAQMLENGGFMRVFDLRDFETLNQEIIGNFYSAVISNADTMARQCSKIEERSYQTFTCGESAFINGIDIGPRHDTGLPPLGAVPYIMFYCSDGRVSRLYGNRTNRGFFQPRVPNGIQKFATGNIFHYFGLSVSSIILDDVSIANFNTRFSHYLREYIPSRPGCLVKGFQLRMGEFVTETSRTTAIEDLIPLYDCPHQFNEGYFHRYANWSCPPGHQIAGVDGTGLGLFDAIRFACTDGSLSPVYGDRHDPSFLRSGPRVPQSIQNFTITHSQWANFFSRIAYNGWSVSNTQQLRTDFMRYDFVQSQCRWTGVSLELGYILGQQRHNPFLGVRRVTPLTTCYSGIYVELVRQYSATWCSRNRNFGLLPGEQSRKIRMYVDKGCRGEFMLYPSREVIVCQSWNFAYASCEFKSTNSSSSDTVSSSMPVTSSEASSSLAALPSSSIFSSSAGAQSSSVALEEPSSSSALVIAIQTSSAVESSSAPAGQSSSEGSASSSAQTSDGSPTSTAEPESSSAVLENSTSVAAASESSSSAAEVSSESSAAAEISSSATSEEASSSEIATSSLESSASSSENAIATSSLESSASTSEEGSSSEIALATSSLESSAADSSSSSPSVTETSSPAPAESSSAAAETSPAQGETSPTSEALASSSTTDHPASSSSEVSSPESSATESSSASASAGSTHVESSSEASSESPTPTDQIIIEEPVFPIEDPVFPIETEDSDGINDVDEPLPTQFFGDIDLEDLINDIINDFREEFEEEGETEVEVDVDIEVIRPGRPTETVLPTDLNEYDDLVVNIHKSVYTAREVVPTAAPEEGNAPTEPTTQPAIDAEEQKTVVVEDKASTGAVYGIMVPAFVISAGLGLLLLRRTKAIAQDIHYAFKTGNSTSDGKNPLYESLVIRRDNPLYSNSEDGIHVTNIQDAAA